MNLILLSRIGRSAACALLLLACVQPGSGENDARDGCLPVGLDKDALLQLRADEFKIDDTSRREQFAFDLIDCLGDPDPVLRDQIAYEAYATLLRGKQLRPETVHELRTRLIAQLETSMPDDPGFRRPFAALALSEVVRADRMDALFSDDERANLVNAAVKYMKSISDYRGFDEDSGWRHGVAHTADLLLQLALNPSLDRDQLLQVRDAVASRVVPPNTHFYIYGESGRLARPIFAIAQRSVLTAEEWQEWFEALASPAPLESWTDAYASQAGLAQLHNRTSFVQAIYVSASASESDAYAPLLDGSLSVLRALP